MNIGSPPPHGVLSLVGGVKASFPDDLVGLTLRGRYRIDEVLHRGTGSVVFRATHLSSGRAIALRIVSPESSPEVRQGVERAAALASEFENDRFPRIVDRGETEDGLPFVATELLDGASLAAWEKPISPERVVTLIAQVLQGLRLLHKKRVTHANLSPSKLFVEAADGKRSQVKILGLDSAVSADDPRLVSVSGLSAGTPGYIAPEQIAGADFDHRADLYAVGVIFYELLTGESAWSGCDQEGLLQHQVGHSVPALPSELSAFDRVIQRLSARDPTDRFSSAAAAVEALEAAVLGRDRSSLDVSVLESQEFPVVRSGGEEPPRKKPWLVYGLVGAVAVLLGVLVVRDGGGAVEPAEDSKLESSVVAQQERTVENVVPPSEGRQVRQPSAEEAAPTAPFEPSAAAADAVDADEQAAAGKQGLAAPKPARARTKKRKKPKNRGDVEGAPAKTSPVEEEAVATQDEPPAVVAEASIDETAQTEADEPQPSVGDSSPLMAPRARRGPRTGALLK